MGKKQNRPFRTIRAKGMAQQEKRTRKRKGSQGQGPGKREQGKQMGKHALPTVCGKAKKNRKTGKKGKGTSEAQRRKRGKKDKRAASSPYTKKKEKEPHQEREKNEAKLPTNYNGKTQNKKKQNKLLWRDH